MADTYANIHVFLGDGATAEPHRELLATMPDLVGEDGGWQPSAPEPASPPLPRAPDGGASTRVVVVGLAERWLPVYDSLLDTAEPGDFESSVTPLSVAISRRWPAVALAGWPAPTAPERGAATLRMLLFRDGALVDRYGNRAAPDTRDWGSEVGGSEVGASEVVRRAHCGNPEPWADLLGTRRNAARLEQAWSSTTEAEVVLRTTAEIVGWDLALARRGFGTAASAGGQMTKLFFAK